MSLVSRFYTSAVGFIPVFPIGTIYPQASMSMGAYIDIFFLVLLLLSVTRSKDYVYTRIQTGSVLCCTPFF